MSIATELERTDTARQNLIANVNAKGVVVPSTAGLNAAVAEVLNIPQGGGDPTRPSEWLPMPDIGPEEQKFAGLLHIAPVDNNYFTLYFDDAMIVTVGNNTPFNLAKNTAYYGKIAWSDCEASTTMANGWRQVLVTAVPQEGKNLVRFVLDVQHPDRGNKGHIIPWVDIKVGSPYLTYFFMRTDTSLSFAYLRYFTIVSSGQWSSYMSNAFKSTTINVDNLTFDCKNSESWIATNNWAGSYRCGVKNLKFLNSSKLRYISSTCKNWGVLSTFYMSDASSVTTTNNIFGDAYNVQSVRMPGLSVSISVAETCMEAAALNLLFGDLAVAVGKTIDVRNTPGAATCDDSIATAKGWTVTKA